MPVVSHYRIEFLANKSDFGFDVISFQECSKQTADLETYFEGGHAYIASRSGSNFRSVGLIIHSRRIAGILKTYCNEVACSVYCKVQGDTGDFTSAYLPHSGWSHLHYTAALHQLTGAVGTPLPTGCTAHRTWLGMGANVVFGRGRGADPEPHVPPFCSGRRDLRGADLAQWCFEKGFCVLDGTENLGADLVTHMHWGTKVRSQIDYVPVDESTLPHLTLAKSLWDQDCASDHLCVKAGAVI